MAHDLLTKGGNIPLLRRSSAEDYRLPAVVMSGAPRAWLKPDAGAETAPVLSERYLRGEEWEGRVVSRGWGSGLATDYGIAVDEASEPSLDDAGSTAPDVLVDSRSGNEDDHRGAMQEFV